MPFDNDKKVFLEKTDKSKKGEVDKEIKHVVDLINSKENLYTTSSCAGRIVLLKCSETNKKYEVEWLYLTHGDAVFEDVKKAIEDIPKEEIWLKQESAILHVGCRTISDAQKIINIAKQVGFKRTGIISAEKKIIVEILSTERVDTVVAMNGEKIVDDNYLKIMVDMCNKKLNRTREKMEKFLELISSSLQ